MITESYGHIVSIDLKRKGDDQVRLVNVKVKVVLFGSAPRFLFIARKPGGHQVNRCERETARPFGIDKVGSLPARMSMPADIQAARLAPREDSSHLIRVLNREKWHQRMVIAFLLRV